MGVLYIPLILSGLCRITGHSVLGMIRRKTSRWLGGFIHSLPPELHASWIPRGLLLWCSRKRCADQKYGLQPPLALWSSVNVHTDPFVWTRSITSSSSVCFHPVFYGLSPQHGAVRTKKRQPPPFLVLYWTWHTKAQEFKTWGARAVCVGGWEYISQA